MKIIFETQEFVEHKISEENLIQLKVFGVSLHQQPDRPVLILKDETGEHALPVSLSPIETGVLVQQSHKGSVSNPHRFAQLMLESMGIKIEKAVFESLKDHQQYVRLFLDGHPSHGSFQIKAEEAISLCLQLDVPLFATKKYIQKSRVMSAQSEGVLKNIATQPSILQRNHEYLN